MLRFFQIMAGCVLAATSVGCIQQKQLVKIKPDGSGQLIVTVMMDKGKLQMLKQMSNRPGGPGGAPAGGEAKEPEFLSEKEAKENASKYGKGVKFVSAKPVETDKFQGLEAVYSFEDVTQLTLSQNPSTPKPPSGPGGPGGPGAPGGNEPAEKKVTFKFKKLPNGRSLLTLAMPYEEKKEDAPKEAPPADKPDKADEAGQAMAAQMLKGMKMEMVVEVEGKLQRTNCPHRKGNQVTVMSVEMDKLFSDPEKFKKMQGDLTREEAKEVFQNIEGVKMFFEKELEIEFE